MAAAGNLREWRGLDDYLLPGFRRSMKSLANE
jgi:hypothetical protein